MRVATGFNIDTNDVYELVGISEDMYGLRLYTSDTWIMTSKNYPHVFAALSNLCSSIIFG